MQVTVRKVTYFFPLRLNLSTHSLDRCRSIIHKDTLWLFPIHSHFRKYSPLHFTKKVGAAL